MGVFHYELIICIWIYWTNFRGSAKARWKIMLCYKLCYQPSQSTLFHFLFAQVSEYSVSEQDSFLFTKLEIIILEVKDLLNYALIWNIFEWIYMWGILSWNVLDEALQLQVKLLVLKTGSSKVNLGINILSLYYHLKNCEFQWKRTGIEMNSYFPCPLENKLCYLSPGRTVLILCWDFWLVLWWHKFTLCYSLLIHTVL